MDDLHEPPETSERQPPPIRGARCGYCMFFKRASFYKKPCEELGIKTFARPCQAFLVNPYMIDLHKDSIEYIASSLANLNTASITKMNVLLNQEVATRRAGFYFGQEIIVRKFGDDFLSNHCIARVIMANNIYVFVQDRHSNFRGMYLHKHVFTLESWEKKRKQLVFHKRLVDPDYAKYTSYKPKPKPKAEAEEKLPTIDMLDKPVVRSSGKPRVVSL